jgi:hypothetical protein
MENSLSEPQSPPPVDVGEYEADYERNTYVPYRKGGHCEGNESLVLAFAEVTGA